MTEDRTFGLFRTVEQVTTYGRIMQEQVQEVEKTPRNYRGNILINIHDIYNLMILGYIAHISHEKCEWISNSDSDSHKILILISDDKIKKSQEYDDISAGKKEYFPSNI